MYAYILLLLLLLLLLFSKREGPGLNNVKVAQSLSDLAVYRERKFIFSTTGSANPFIKLNESEGLLRSRRSYQGIQKKKRR